MANKKTADEDDGDPALLTDLVRISRPTVGNKRLALSMLRALFGETIILDVSRDETTAITTGTGKYAFRLPYAFTLTGILASLTTAQTSGSIFTVDVNEAGVSVLSTKITIDNTEETSATAAAPPVISDASLAANAEISVDVDQVGDGTAAGLKIYLIGHK
jgi:hypothetical protein